MNTIHRIRHHCELHNYKPVQAKTIAEQFQFAKQAIEEESTFFKAIGDSKWPEHMETVQENLLRTTLCNKELTRNQGNDGDVLPSIWKCFKSLYPAKALNIENGESVDGEGTDMSTGDDSNDANSDDHQNGSPAIPSTGQLDEAEDEAERMTPEQRNILRIESLQDESDEKLVTAGIETFDMELPQFMATKWGTSSPKADLVFSCITDVKENSFVENLPEFCKLVTKPGSYVFLITTVMQFVRLFQLFKDQGFKVSDHPFDIVYDISTVQRKTMSDFPQHHSDMALICRYPGIHPDGFHPFHRDQQIGESVQRSEEASSSQSSDDFDYGAHFASLLNVATCRSKLKRPRSNAPIFSWEKNCELVTRIVQTFCPFEGVVVDPFPGPLTTALACLKSKRSCVSISSECDGFNYALGRLRIHAAGNATLEQLEDFSRQVKTPRIAPSASSPNPEGNGSESKEVNSSPEGMSTDTPTTISPEHLLSQLPSSIGDKFSPDNDSAASDGSASSGSPAKKRRMDGEQGESENEQSAAEALMKMNTDSDT